ncbi:MAG: hypothetical protein LBJ63_05790 [Prevotellaceae bacterium]|jgi:hypothetical protein|nr:hypothetical protein [Prevotellaceae bacterium]
MLRAIYKSITVLKGCNFHNRRSATCGMEATGSYCLKGRTSVRSICPAFQAEAVVAGVFHRSATCGYEDIALHASGISVETAVNIRQASCRDAMTIKKRQNQSGLQ